MNASEIEAMKPYGNNVLMKLSPRKTQSSGGIVLPQNQKVSTWHSGIVLKTGPGKRNMKTGERIPSQLEVGKKVVFKAFSDGWEMFEAKDTGEKYMIMAEDHIEFYTNADENL